MLREGRSHGVCIPRGVWPLAFPPGLVSDYFLPILHPLCGYLPLTQRTCLGLSHPEKNNPSLTSCPSSDGPMFSLSPQQQERTCRVGLHFPDSCTRFLPCSDSHSQSPVNPFSAIIRRPQSAKSGGHFSALTLQGLCNTGPAELVSS